MATVTQRPATSGGVPKMVLPKVQHPMAKLGNRKDLNIRGESRMGRSVNHGFGGVGMRAERTAISVDAGMLRKGPESDALPPLQPDASRPWPGRTLAAEEGDTPLNRTNFSWVSDYGNSKERPNSRQKMNAQVTSRYDVDDLHAIIQEKMSTGYHGLQHLFRANDPTGFGHVSKDALLRIIYSLCGYITNEQYSKLLKSIGLESRSYISFENFVNCFQEKEKVHHEWLTPAKSMPIQHGHPAILSHHDYPLTADAAFVKLKEKLRKGEAAIHSILPDYCFEPNGHILPPHLYELLSHLNINVHHMDISRLWSKFDSMQCGSLRTSYFLKLLGLDELGKPRPYTSHVYHRQETRTTPKTTPKIPHASYNPIKKYSVKLPPIRKKRVTFMEQVPEVEKDVDEEEEEREKENVEAESHQVADVKRKKVMIRRKRMTPKLDSAIDCLHFMFDEAYLALEMGCQCFDFLGDGFISRLDLRNVLREFGLSVSAMDLEYFLSRCGIRIIQGQIAYKELLQKFWNRSESGLVNRIITNKFHLFSQSRGWTPAAGETLSVEQLEAKLIEFLHGDFLLLLGLIKHYDYHHLGVVKPSDMRSCMERVLGYTLHENQWQEILTSAGADTDGLIPYPTFMDQFNGSPGSWNIRDINGTSVAKVNLSKPPELAKFQDRAKNMTNKAKSELQVEAENAKKHRTKEELNDLMRELFRVRFHTIDKVFKKTDRKMTGRFNRQQLDEVIKSCDVTLTLVELERLWNSLEIAPDGMCSFHSLARHFSHFNHHPPPIKGKLPMDVTDNKDILLVSDLDLDDKISECEDDSSMIEKVRKFRQEKKEANTLTNQQPKRVIQIPRVTTQERDQLLEKVKFDVVSRWDAIKTIFKQMDRDGCATITADKMKNMMKMFNFNISEEEQEKLTSRYDLKGDGNFHYIDFMQVFTEKSPSGSPPSFDVNHTQTVLPSDGLNDQLMPEAPAQACNKYSQKLSKRPPSNHPLDPLPAWNRKLINEWKSVRRAFKKMDLTNTGYLNVLDFKRVLESCNIDIDKEDFYHIVSEFDEKMDGKISYEQFLNQLVTTY